MELMQAVGSGIPPLGSGRQVYSVLISYFPRLIYSNWIQATTRLCFNDLGCAYLLQLSARLYERDVLGCQRRSRI
jgi:hypothetical protein